MNWFPNDLNNDDLAATPPAQPPSPPTPPADPAGTPTPVNDPYAATQACPVDSAVPPAGAPLPPPPPFQQPYAPPAGYGYPPSPQGNVPPPPGYAYPPAPGFGYPPAPQGNVPPPPPGYGYGYPPAPQGNVPPPPGYAYPPAPGYGQPQVYPPPSHYAAPPYPPPGPQYTGDPMAAYQPVTVQKGKPPRTARKSGLGCLPTALLLLLIALAVYFFAPLRTTFLVLGIDRAPDGTDMGRSDTIILVSANPLTADIKMLSIPRDLWVSIPGIGENRINTAHFFAEVNLPGSGPAATQAVIRDQFGVDPKYYVRIRFDGVREVVDALGGVEVTLTEGTNLLPAGTHLLNGDQALAFARDRSGADDFFRMAHGQILIKAIAKQALSPASWIHLPAFYNAVMNSLDTDLPVVLWPRLALALIRSGVDGIDSRTLTREQVTPWTTSEGANVLLPNWDAIRPMVTEMFGGW